MRLDEKLKKKNNEIRRLKYLLKQTIKPLECSELDNDKLVKKIKKVVNYHFLPLKTLRMINKQTQEIIEEMGKWRYSDLKKRLELYQKLKGVD